MVAAALDRRDAQAHAQSTNSLDRFVRFSRTRGRRDLPTSMLRLLLDEETT